MRLCVCFATTVHCLGTALAVDPFRSEVEQKPVGGKGDQTEGSLKWCWDHPYRTVQDLAGGGELQGPTKKEEQQTSVRMVDTMKAIESKNLMVQSNVRIQNHTSTVYSLLLPPSDQLWMTRATPR